MRKIYIFAIAALGAFALASCSQEKESPVVASNGAKLTVTLGEGAKATMTNPTNTGAGFVFQSGDVINWVSDSGNASYTYDGPDSNTITFDVEIPGLDEGDVEGYFAVNFTDEVPYCYNASNPTQAKAGINPDCFFLSSFTKTLSQGSTSVSVDVKTVGGVFAFQFKGAGDKVFKVEVGAENAWCNNASFDGYALVVDPIMSKLATNVNIETSDDYGTQCVFVPVPSGVTLDSPYVKIYAESGIYTYDLGGTVVAPEGDLTFEDGVILKVKMSIGENHNADTYEEWPKGKVELTAACISSNDPMQYVVGGSDEYGFQSNPDWFASINGTQAANREARYGKATNLWDDDASTCYHTNLDWGEPDTSWGQRSYSINNNQYEKRYIQVTLPAGMNKFDLEFTNADSGREAEGLELLVTTDGSTWTTVPDTDFSKDFGAENSAEGVSADGALITALRIRNTKGDSDWTFTKAAFGISELAVYGAQIDVTDPGKVTNVSLDKTSATIVMGSSTQLNATVYPVTADVTDVIWTSSDPSVATVSGGLVTSVAPGTAEVTVKTVDGGFVAKCTVTVVDLPVIALTADCISSNDPMQYVSQGQSCDQYGFGSPDWFNPITPSQSTAREAKYGKAENMWDDDVTTCFHTNKDWGVPYSSWGNRTDLLDQYVKRYIQVTLPTSGTYKDVKLYFRTSDSGNVAEGFNIYYSNQTEPASFTKVGSTISCTGFGQEVVVEGITDSNGLAAIKIENSRSDADWTCAASAFGISEVKVFDKTQ